MEDVSCEVGAVGPHDGADLDVTDQAVGNGEPQAVGTEVLDRRDL